MLDKVKNLVVEEDGQALTEYGLIIGLIAVVCIAALVTIGDKLNGVFENIKGWLETITPDDPA